MRKVYNKILTKFIEESLDHWEDMRYGQFIQNFVYPHHEGYGHIKMFHEEPKQTVQNVRKRIKGHQTLVNILNRLEDEYETDF